MSIKTREITHSDIDTVVSLCCEVQNIHISFSPDIFKPLNKTELKQWFENRFNEKGTSIIIASMNNVDVGYLMLKLRHRTEHLFCYDQKFIEIDQICVTESARNSGVGHSLIESAKQITRDQGLSRMELNVWSLNDKAKNTFEAMGFSTYSEKKAIQC